MKYNFCRTFFLVLLQFILLTGNIFSQDSLQNRAEANIGVDFATQYMWRGLVLSKGPVLQPAADISLNNLTFGLWGSTTFSATESKELDVYVNYDFRDFSFSVIDYFTYFDSASPSFFNYNKDESGHIIETTAAFGGTDKIPFRFLAGVNLFGDSTHSTYFEAAWLSGIGETDIEIVAGYTPQSGYYHESKKGFTNVGANFMRSIPMNDRLSLNIKFSVFYAPLVDQTYFALLIGLK
ncbi:MAG: hypothetical protein ACOYN5_01850 [Bacteroidales bacterium]